MQPFNFFSPLASALFSAPMLPCDIEPPELVDPCDALEPVDPCEAAGDELCVPCAPLESLCGVDWATATATKNADRKSTRLNSSHSQISYAVFCLKKKKQQHQLEGRERYSVGYLAGRGEFTPRSWLVAGYRDGGRYYRRNAHRELAHRGLAVIS